jgi:4'-phosphopantetheinyl transferase
MADDAFIDLLKGATRRELITSLECEVHVWVLDPDTAGVDVCEWCDAALSTGERERMGKFLREADRRSFLLARGLVRAVLSRYADLPAAAWTFAAGEHGRPEISNRDAPVGLRFNLSHTRGRITILVHGADEAGIDVERLGRVDDPAALGQRFFTPEEHADLMSCPGPQRDLHFVRLWTLKEAYIKARGLSLAMNGKKFWFEFSDAGDIQVHFDEGLRDEASAWSFAAYPSGDQHILATAVRRRPDGTERTVRHFI